MARLGEIQLKSGIKDIDQVMNYLYQLEEQLRYALNNLDSENIRDGAISAEQFHNRMTLRAAMMHHGFQPLKEEWWHFTLAGEPYPETYFDFPVK